MWVSKRVVAGEPRSVKRSLLVIGFSFSQHDVPGLSDRTGILTTDITWFHTQ